MNPELWQRLTPSAREMLSRAAEKLADGHSGTIELHCHKGGVRLLKVGMEFRPNEKEIRPSSSAG